MSDIKILGLSDRLNQLWEDYISAIQVDKTGNDLTLLARFMIEAKREGFVMEGSHVDIVLPHEVWGNDIPLQTSDFVDAMAALLEELEKK